ncbi:MAG: DUF4168 domain-containing protein [Bacteroidota bacterium]
MNFKYFGIIILVVTITFGCQSNNKNQQNETGYENASQKQQDHGQFQQPQQQQQQPGGEVSDKELQQFASVAQHLQGINQQAQQEMVAALEKEGLKVERFNELQQAENNQNQVTDATDKELKQYEVATRELEKIQGESQQKMQEKIKDEGLTENRYQEIYMALQNDPELQEKFQALQQPNN